MRNKMESLTCEQAKQLDLVDYLRQLGYEPVRISQPSYWFNSPFRTEKDASFKVNRKLNKWYDFGEGKGGNLVDFGTRFFNCSVREFLEKLSSQRPVAPSPKHTETEKQEDGKKIVVTDVRPLTSLALTRYLERRLIPPAIYDKYCKQVHYQLGEKNYYAIGFKNNSGGYELRNEHIKASSSPKDVTLVAQGGEDLAVFEGFFNFLTYLTLERQLQAPKTDFLILNSASFFEKSKEIMDRYRQANLFLDRDSTGQKFTRMAIQWDPFRYKDQSGLYLTHKDLNDWVLNVGKGPSQSQQHRSR